MFVLGIVVETPVCELGFEFYQYVWCYKLKPMVDPPIPLKSTKQNYSEYIMHCGSNNS